MNVLYLISTLGQGGAEKQLVSWTQIMQADLGARVFVASFDAGRTHWAQALREMDVPVTVLGREKSVVNRTLGVMSLARRHRIDVVHAFSCYLSPLAVAASLASDAVPASSVRGDGLADLQSLRAVYRRPVLAMVRYMTANSREAIAQIKPRISAKTLVQYVPNLVEAPPCLDRASRSPTCASTKTVLMVGRLDRNKRIDLFLHALAKARTLESGLRGVVVGEGPLSADLHREAEQLGLLPHGVEFTGRLDDVSTHYADADVFVHLAMSEGTPNVVLEAMAAGLPVVTTGAGDLRHIVKPGLTGILVPFDDDSLLAESLVQLARAPELRARLGMGARDEMLHSFNRQVVRDALEGFYCAIPLSKERPRNLEKHL
jgi:glycosyltransferase involved in cell wall biosynthesis